MSKYDAVPHILTDLPQWIVWRLETRNAKETKVPYDAKKKNAYAKSNEPDTWTTFEQAVAVADDAITSSYDGIGFMLKGTNLVGIDFDGVRNEDGSVEPYIADILLKLGNPYCEITPSGNGLRVFVECAQLPRGQRKFSDGHHYGAEIYSGGEGGRYLTVTGNRYCGEGVPKIDDISLVYFMVSQIRNTKLKKLWMGDISDYESDASRADLALMGILARLFNNSAAKMEWAFNGSKLALREKWIDREDYRERTIKKAISGKTIPDEEDGNQSSPVEGSEELVETREPNEIVIRDGNEIKLKKIKWLWENRIPLGKITLFAGNPDNGKSLAATSLAAAVTTGHRFPDAENSTPPSDVLMLLGEDDIEDTAAIRLIAAGADMKKIHFIEAVHIDKAGDKEIRLDQDISTIEIGLKRFPNVRLIIVDPISNYLGETSMIAEQDVRREILIPLKKLAAAHDIAVVIVMHLNKKNDMDAISRVGGAMAFIGVARCSWLFVRDESDEEGKIADSFSMLRIKNNLAKADKSGLAYKIEAVKIPIPDEGEVFTPFISWGSVVEKSADDALNRHKEREGSSVGRPDDVYQQALSFLLEYLQDGPKPQKDVEEQAKGLYGISSKTLTRASLKLKVKKHQKARLWIWELPENNEVAAKFEHRDGNGAEESLFEVG